MRLLHQFLRLNVLVDLVHLYFRCVFFRWWNQTKFFKTIIIFSIFFIVYGRHATNCILYSLNINKCIQLKNNTRTNFIFRKRKYYIIRTFYLFVKYEYQKCVSNLFSTYSHQWIIGNSFSHYRLYIRMLTRFVCLVWYLLLFRFISIETNEIIYFIFLDKWCKNIT